MGWIDFIASMFSPPQQQGGASSAPIQFVEPDIAHYEKHAEQGNQRAEKIDQAQEAADEELWADISARSQAAAAAAFSQEQAAIGQTVAEQQQAIERAMMETQQAQTPNSAPPGIEAAFASSATTAAASHAVQRVRNGLDHSR